MAGIRQPETVKIENTPSPIVREMNDAVDEHVATVMIFTEDGSTFYYDKDKTNEVDFSVDGKNLFIKGVIANKAGELAIATACSAAGVITFAFSIG